MIIKYDEFLNEGWFSKKLDFKYIGQRIDKLNYDLDIGKTYSDERTSIQEFGFFVDHLVNRIHLINISNINQMMSYMSRLQPFFDLYDNLNKINISVQSSGDTWNNDFQKSNYHLLNDVLWKYRKIKLKIKEVLEILDISFQNLKEFPNVALTERLKELRCNDNQLTSLPELPDSLEKLICYNNKLQSLPNLPENLKELNCDQLFNNIPMKIFKNAVKKDFRREEVRKYLEYRLDKHPEEIVDVPEKYNKLVPPHLGVDYGFFDQEKK